MLSASARPTLRKGASDSRCVSIAVVALLAVCRPALAQNVAACNAAYERADLLIHGPDAGNLLDARESARTCAETSCRPWMIKDCTQWLADLDRRIPSVVFLAKDDRGNDVTDVTVSEGDQVIARRLDGRAIEMNPGERTFVFVGPGGPRVERRSLIREGEKDHVVEVRLDVADAPGGASPAGRAQGVPDGTEGSTGNAGLEDHSSARASASRGRLDVAGTSSRPQEIPWHTLGYAVSGAGAIGLALGSILGAIAIVDNGASNANGHCTEGCDADGASLRRRAVDEANASTIACALGAVLLAPGLSLLVIAPSAQKPSSPANAVRWAPVVTSSTVGWAFHGVF